jgi:GNAT superfamily N-acetyltransferase
MQEPTVRTVDPSEAARAVSVQLLAFVSDPIMRWMWPDPHVYVQSFPVLVRGFGGRAFAQRAAHIAEDFSGGTLWLPPGVSPDVDALEALMRDTLPGPVRSEAYAMLEQMGEAHPTETHWHLAVIGVDPRHHRKGIGSALLQHMLARIDEEGLHAYLESSNPANIPLYQRHGFAVTGEIRVGDSPPVFPMVRPPHATGRLG